MGGLMVSKPLERAQKAQRAQSVEDFYMGDYNLESKIKGATAYQEKIADYFRKGISGLRTSPASKPLLLDVGCGDGSLGAKFASFGYEVYGIDIRPRMIKEARKNGIKAVVHNAEKKFPFRSGMFDAVFAGEIIEHLYDTDFFLHELNRATQHNGIVVVTTPNIGSLYNRLRLLFGKRPISSEYRLGKNMAGHIRNYLFPDLRKQMGEHGFRVVWAVSANIIFPVMWPLPRFMKKAAMFLGNYFPNIGSHIIIGGQKIGEDTYYERKSYYKAAKAIFHPLHRNI